MGNLITRIVIWRECFQISSVSLLDADQLIRECDFPAMIDNPLRLLMFPSSDPMTSEEEILWKIDGLKESLQNPETIFRKVCKNDGTSVGFAGWTIDKGFKKDSEVPRGNNKKQLVKIKSKKSKENLVKLPSNLDINAWVAVSDQFAMEKRRVLQSLGKVWRLNMMSVNPLYQRKGVGSLLMQWGCNEADRNSLDSYILASPVGVQLYQRFGFEKVGEVFTHGAKFTSMLRKAQKGSFGFVTQG